MLAFGLLEDETPASEREEEEDAPPVPPYDTLSFPWDDLEPPQPAPLNQPGGDTPVQQAAQVRPSSPPAPLFQETLYGGTRKTPSPPSPPRGRTVALPRPRIRWAAAAREAVEAILLAVLIFLAVRVSFQNFRVDGNSMMPSLRAHRPHSVAD